MTERERDRENGIAVPAPGQPIALGTGFSALDAVLGGLRSGDNVVWQVESVDDYAPLVRPFAAEAVKQRWPLVYYRFARHPPLVPEDGGARIEKLSPSVGFESFTASAAKGRTRGA